MDIVDVSGVDTIVFKCSAWLFPFCCNRTNIIGGKMGKFGFILFKFQERSKI